MVGSILGAVALSFCSSFSAIASSLTPSVKLDSQYTSLVGQYVRVFPQRDALGNNSWHLYSTFEIEQNTATIDDLDWLEDADFGEYGYFGIGMETDTSEQPYSCVWTLAYLDFHPSVYVTANNGIGSYLEVNVYPDGSMWNIDLSYTDNDVIYDYTHGNQYGDLSFEFRIEAYVQLSYSASVTYSHCSYEASSGDKALPSTYTDATLDNPYFFKVVADEGYYFQKDGSAVSVTGGITIDSIVYNNLVVGDFASYFLIQVRLPSGNCSISFTAVNSASITKNLSGCTTTFPDIYSFGASGTYRIVANEGYCFDSRLDQYSTTGMLVNSVAFANKVYGDLYTTIVLDVTFSDVNAVSVTATAQTYSAQYAQGYKDGEQSGLELKGGLMDLIPNVFASIGAFLFTFSGVNFMGINLLAVVGIVVSVGLIGVVIKVALK